MATDDLPRERLIEKARERLLRKGLPRVQMLILVALTGAAGFLSAYFLLHLGLDSMALRYPLAVAASYGVFLLLLRVWLEFQRQGWGTLADSADLLELGDLVPHGGASNPVVSSTGGGSSGFDLPSVDLDDSGCLVLLALLLITGVILGTTVWVVWTAPVLLAEVLVDGLVMAALYRRLKRAGGPSHWLLGAVRRTWVSALLSALLFSVAGGLLHRAVPEARSIGDAWRAVTSQKR